MFIPLLLKIGIHKLHSIKYKILIRKICSPIMKKLNTKKHSYQQRKEVIGYTEKEKPSGMGGLRIYYKQKKKNEGGIV